MAGYTRQSTAGIVDGFIVEASDHNAEFNQLEAAFNGTTGHLHDGSVGNGPLIDLTTSITGILPESHLPGTITGAKEFDNLVTFKAGIELPNAFGTGNYLVIGPVGANRTTITAAGILARDGGNINLRPNGVSSSVGAAQLSTAGVFTAPSFSGIGTSLTALNASNLASGTVPTARVSGSYTGITGTGALNAGSITSGFGNINIGTSTITSGNISVGSVTASSTISGTNITASGNLSGSGGSITNLNASNLASGTIPNARFPATLPAASGANLTSLNASNLSSGTVPSARVSGSYTGISGIGTLTSTDLLVLKGTAIIGTGANGIMNGGIANYTAGGTGSLGVFAETGTIYFRPNGRTSGTNQGTFSTSGTFAAPAFSGDGSSLTNLNASNLSSGTIPSGRFPSTLPTASGANLTNLNASNLSSGTVASARVSGSYTGITGTGALNAGSITSGFGSINIGSATLTSGTHTIGSGTSQTQITSGGVFARNGGIVYLRPNGSGSSTGQVTLNTSGNLTGTGTASFGSFSGASASLGSISGDTLTLTGNYQNFGTIGRTISSPWSFRWSGPSGGIYVGGTGNNDFSIATSPDVSTNRVFYASTNQVISYTQFRANDRLIANNSIGLSNDSVALIDAIYSSSGHAPTFDYWRNFTGSNPTTDILRVRHGTPAGTAIGGITANNTNVQFNTSSDYRLKENVEDFVASGSMIDQLRPVTFTWKSDGSDGLGFIAHEVQEVFPAAVSYEKDGEEIQQLDNSKLVPILVAELKSLRARVAELEAK